jgi:hypothetical protein
VDGGCLLDGADCRGNGSAQEHVGHVELREEREVACALIIANNT